MPKKNTTRYKSNLQEKKVAKELSGRQQINSGAFWSLLGDVRSDKLLCECKTTEKSYYSLKADTWLKIRSEAINDGLRIPVMCIDLENGKTRVAVFEPNSFEFEALKLLITSNKSIRIEKGMENTIIHFAEYKVRLQVILWEDFINIIKTRGEKV